MPLEPRPSLIPIVGATVVVTWLLAKVVGVSARQNHNKQETSRLCFTSTRQLSDEEQRVQSSIETTMPPAHRMGISIHNINMNPLYHDRDDEKSVISDDSQVGSLSLSMPLEGNTNVHGTAFAGSLYSLCVLCAWYTLMAYMRTQKIDNDYMLVVKSAQISYLRPVQDVDRIVATSFLPSPQECEDFIRRLQKSGKTTLPISGEIKIQTPETIANSSTSSNEATAVQYTALACAFRRQTKV